MAVDIKKKVLSSLVWSFVRTWGGRLAGFVIYFQLVRVLAPSEVGAFAAAYAVLVFLEIFIDQGLMHALIQRPTLTPGLINAAFLVNLGAAAVIVAALWLAAPALEAALGIPELARIVRIASFTVLLNALCLCQDALLRREFMFRRLAVRILLATIVGGAAGIYLAYAGFGVWALVGQYMTAATVGVVTLWYRPVWRPTRALDFRGLGALSRYGLNIIGVRLLEFGSSRFVEFWIAATLGASALGFFSVGSKISYILLQLLGTSVLDVALAGFSRMAADSRRLLNAYYKIVRVTAALAFPCWAMLAMAPTEVTALAFGAKWLPSAPLLVPLALLGLVQTSQIFDSALVNAIGRPALGVLFLVLRTAVVLLSLIVTARQPLAIVVAGYAGAQLAVAPLNLVLLKKLAGISPVRFLSNLAAPAAATAVLCASILALEWAAPLASSGPLASLAAKAAVGASAYAITLALLDRSLLTELLGDLRALRKRADQHDVTASPPPAATARTVQT